MKDQNVEKLAPNWEGPYRVTTVAGTGAYYLKNMEERPLPQPWNVSNLNCNIIIVRNVQCCK